MRSLAPTFSINLDDRFNEIHFSATGLWDMPTMIAFQRDLLATAKPLIDQQSGFHALGDLRGLVTQTRQVAEAMRVVIVESQKLGVLKTALIFDNALARMQHERLNDGINFEMFENRLKQRLAARRAVIAFLTASPGSSPFAD